MATNTTHATSQASVSESNRSRIVKHLYHNGISSRAQIAKALELTPRGHHQNHRTPYRGRHD
ncbi:hypothetical protein BILO6462_05550 [Bifidobacterium longum subsp. longum]